MTKSGHGSLKKVTELLNPLPGPKSSLEYAPVDIILDPNPASLRF